MAASSSVIDVDVGIWLPPTPALLRKIFKTGHLDLDQGWSCVWMPWRDLRFRGVMGLYFHCSELAGVTMPTFFKRFVVWDEEHRRVGVGEGA